MTTDDTSHDAAQAVTSREELVRYLEALHRELINGADWENHKLDRFLESMAAWIRDTSKYHEHTGQPLSDNATWSFFAQALGAATLYE